MRALIAAFVVLAHVAAIVLAVYQPEEDKEQPKKAVTDATLVSGDVELQPKLEDTLNREALHLSCPSTYEGIGIKRRWGGMVTEVAKGWPADRAGILPGDIVEPWMFEPVDGFMEFEVVRGAKRVKMRLKTEKICFRDRPF